MLFPEFRVKAALAALRAPLRHDGPSGLLVAHDLIEDLPELDLTIVTVGAKGSNVGSRPSAAHLGRGARRLPRLLRGLGCTPGRGRAP